MKRSVRNNLGAVIVEAALAIPIFLFLIFGLVEMSRMLYIKSTMSVAAQQVANLISTNASRTPSYDVPSFSTYANRVRFAGSVIDSSQFRFDVVDVNNSSTVVDGMADGATSTKVVVTVIFPPPSNPALRVPSIDIGRLFGAPLFGPNGLTLSAQAICFLERSRRPILN